MFLLIERTGKKTEILLPHVLDFAAELMQPLTDKIDTVHYTQRSRVLKVAEDYATRLLQPTYPDETAKAIARHLVNAHSEHGFVINREEIAGLLRLSFRAADAATQRVINGLERELNEHARLLPLAGAKGGAMPTDKAADDQANGCQPSRPEEVRSKDAVETAIDRSKDRDRTWESVLPSTGSRWSKSEAVAGNRISGSHRRSLLA